METGIESKARVVLACGLKTLWQVAKLLTHIRSRLGCRVWTGQKAITIAGWTILFEMILHSMHGKISTSGNHVKYNLIKMPVEAESRS